MNRLLLSALLVTVAGPALSAAPVDVVIRGGTIYSGEDAAPITGDVEITGDRVVYVGPTRRTPATRVIDARGQNVAPG